MTDLIRRYVIPQAYQVLPLGMASDGATAMLLAIGLQESGFLARRQLPTGPARGFWQFEIAGVVAVLAHERTRDPIRDVLKRLRYDPYLDVEDVHAALEHSDVLACCFARCLLWASLLRLPGVSDQQQGWELYERAWRPGQPRPEAWPRAFQAGWRLVDDDILKVQRA